MAQARKLYFDVSLTSGAPSASFALTEGDGDRYQALLEALPALTGNATGDDKHQHEVTAFFLPLAAAEV